MLVTDLEMRIKQNEKHLKDAISDVLDSGWFVLGQKVKEFEKAFANYVGASYCVGLANGTDAIELGLRSLGVSEGDKVATVANAGMYTTSAILAIGAEPYFLDVDLVTKNVTLAECEGAVHAGVKAIVVTHLYGLSVPDIEKIASMCRIHEVPLLEDCAQAHGAKINSQYVGTFGDAASFSFYPTKNLGALGDGGALVTNIRTIAECVKRLSQYGWSSKYRVEMRGGRNSRLDEIQAAILLVFLPKLDSANDRRREIATYYSQMISHPNIELPPVYGEEYVAHLYVLKVRERESLQAHLDSHSISSAIHYPVPDHRQPIFNNLFDHLCLESTEQLCDEVLTLPCYPELTDIEVRKVVECVNAW